MSRDLALHFSNKLAGEWSASTVTPQLSPAVIEDLASASKWDALDPLVRVRLLLAPMFLRGAELHDLRGSLRALTSAAVTDNDEWVRVIAAAVGQYDGRLHMDAVKEHSRLVSATLDEVRRYGAAADARIYRPLEERYLSPKLTEQLLAGGDKRVFVACLEPAIPHNVHFIYRDPSSAPGATTATTGTPIQGSQAMQRLAQEAAASTIAPVKASAVMGKPPLVPSRVDSGHGVLAERDIFLSKKPKGGGSLLGRTALGKTFGVTGVSRFPPKAKKAALLDVTAVTRLNQAAAEERERKRREEEAAKEAAKEQEARAKAEAKAAQRLAKEQAKLHAKSAKVAEVDAAKEAEKEAARERKEAEKAAKEAQAATAKAEREALKAKREAEKAEKLAAMEAAKAERQAAKEKAAQGKLKRTHSSSAGDDAKKPSKAPRIDEVAPLAVLPSVGATTGQRWAQFRPPGIPVLDPLAALEHARGLMLQAYYGALVPGQEYALPGMMRQSNIAARPPAHVNAQPTANAAEVDAGPVSQSEAE